VAKKAQQLGGNSAQLRQLLAYVQSQSGDYAAIARDSAARSLPPNRPAASPARTTCFAWPMPRNGRTTRRRYSAALEKLVLHYPKKDYWNAYLARIQRKPGFADRLALDVMRLKLANGLHLGERLHGNGPARAAGRPAVRGQADRRAGLQVRRAGHRPRGRAPPTLEGLADKQAAEASAALDKEAAEAAQAKDGNGLVKVGYAYVTMGQADKGVPLIEQGIAKGGLKRPDEAKLRLGMAQMKAGAKARGVQTLRTVGGKDGTADIARLWITHFNSQG
jgi:hypothetical protein